jgi:hypothetical protein
MDAALSSSGRLGLIMIVRYARETYEHRAKADAYEGCA